MALSILEAYALDFSFFECHFIRLILLLRKFIYWLETSSRGITRACESS